MFKIHKGLLESTDPLKFIYDLSNEATGVYTKLGLWSALKGLDGVVTFGAMEDVKAAESTQDELLDAGLLVMNDSNFTITGWEEHQVTAAKLAARAVGTRERMRKLRERRAAAQGVTLSPVVAAVVMPLPAKKAPLVTPSLKEKDDVTPSHGEVVQADHQESCFSDEPVTDDLPTTGDDTADKIPEDEVVIADITVVDVDSGFTEEELEMMRYVPEEDEEDQKPQVSKVEAKRSSNGRGESRRKDFTKDEEPRFTAKLQEFDDEEIDVLLASLEKHYPGMVKRNPRGAFKEVLRRFEAEDVIVAAKQLDRRSPGSMFTEDFPTLKDWLVSESFKEEAVFQIGK